MSKNTTIQHKRSSVSGNVPDNNQIDVGELAINFPDRTLYTKDGEGQIIELGSNTASHEVVLDASNCTSPDFTGGSGTESDPFTVEAIQANFSDVEVHVATVKITGLNEGTVVYVQDLFSDTNGDRFTAGNRIADEDGVLTVNIAFNDNPESPTAIEYNGKMRIGGNIYIDVGVTVFRDLEGGTVLAGPTNTEPAGPAEWKGAGGRTLTATYPLTISDNGIYFTDIIETDDNDTEVWLKWAGDPGSGEGIDGPDGETIRGSVTDGLGGAQFFELTIQKEVSFVFQNFVDSDQPVGSQSESRVSTVYDVNSYVYPSGTTTGDSAQYAVNGGDWQDMPADSGGASRSSSTHYMVEGDEFQLRHRNALTPNTTSTFNFIAAGDSANWTTVTADLLTIKQPTIVSPAKDNTIDISPTGPFVSSDFEMAEGVDTHTASSWELIYSEFTRRSTISFPQYTYAKTLHAIAWNGSVFCAIGEEDSEYNEIHKSVCITSPDGITWTRQTSLESVVSETIYAISWSGSVFCAVGERGVCATSPDGVTWTEQPNLADISGNFHAIEWNGSVFCAVGIGGEDAIQGVCATSPDGVTWTERTSLGNVVGLSKMQGIAWDGNQFCAVGAGIGDGIKGVCATSPDGITWTKRPSLSSVVDNRMLAIAWDGNQFCAVGRGGNCATSPDGITWTRQPSFTSAVDNSSMSAIGWNGNQFFAVGAGGKCATSPDGVAWTYRPSLARVLSSQSAKALAWDGTQFCVVGYGWYTATSSNTVVASLDSDTSALTSWQPSGLSPKTLYTIRVKHHTASLTSEWSDGRIFETLPEAGVDWVAQPDLAKNVLDASDRKSPMNAMVWTGTQFCAVGAFSGTPGICVTSPDGITWTRQPSFEPLFPSNQLPLAIAWTGSQFCVTGYYSACATSPDGITWTQRTGLSSALGGSSKQVISGLVWTGSQFCAVGGNGDCATSPDGITWTKRPSLASAVGAGRQIRNLVWNGSQFCAVGYQGVCATSPDGITWTERAGLASVLGDLSVNGGGQSGADMFAISWDGNQFCTVGRNGNCATSPDGITWTQRPSLAEVTTPSMSVNGELFDVFWNNDRNEFIAVGASAQCATSPDGITWTRSPRLKDAIGSYILRSVEWDGNQYCVVGQSGTCATSPY